MSPPPGCVGEERSTGVEAKRRGRAKPVESFSALTPSVQTQ